MIAADFAPCMSHAACARPGIDPEVFFPPNGGAAPAVVSTAKTICDSCPVRTQCLDYVSDPEPGDAMWTNYGIYGGLTAQERTTGRPAQRPGRRPVLQPHRDAILRAHAAGQTAIDIARRYGVTDDTVGKFLRANAPDQPRSQTA